MNDYPGTLDFEARKRVQEKFNEQRADRSERALRFFSRQLSMALGEQDFWDLDPALQAQCYGMYPPVQLDGSVTPYAGTGPWNWPQIAAEFPAEFERHQQNYERLRKQAFKKIGAALA